MTRRTKITKTGTAQISPQIHKMAAASCWERKSPAIAIPGIEAIDEYQA